MLELFTPDWKELWSTADLESGVGSVYTRPEIVSLILDLAGFLPDRQRLLNHHTLEPSCGKGAFVIEIVRRIIQSEQIRTEVIDWHDTLWDQALLTADLDQEAIEHLRGKLSSILLESGCPEERATELSKNWTVHTDFLLHDWQGTFDFIFGNPPYIRIEDIPKPVLRRYRESYTTTTDRADIYVAFIERSLQLLSPNGTLGMICTNRFTKNKYGTRLRELISSSHHVSWYINLEHAQPFEQHVSAYPAIFIIDNNRNAPTRASTLNEINPKTLEALKGEDGEKEKLVSTFPTWYCNGTPWISTSRSRLDFLRSLEKVFSPLGEHSTEITVGIGVATGADKVFILSGKRDDIEEQYQLPLLMSAHVGSHELHWTGEHLLNPFADENTGKLVQLQDAPGLRNHFLRHESILRQRYVVRSSPENWYRTIDRVWPSLVKQPKLVIPDIQAGNVVGYDPGEFYPHHNLYWITSSVWDMRALQAIFRSSLVRLQVEAYSVQMRGGSLRYQAQTLRLVRIPRITDLDDMELRQLSALGSSCNIREIDNALRPVMTRKGIDVGYLD